MPLEVKYINREKPDDSTSCGAMLLDYDDEKELYNALKTAILRRGEFIKWYTSLPEQLRTEG